MNWAPEAAVAERWASRKQLPTPTSAAALGPAQPLLASRPNPRHPSAAAPGPRVYTHPWAPRLLHWWRKTAAPTVRRAAPAAPCSPFLPRSSAGGGSLASLRLLRSCSHFPAPAPWRLGAGIDGKGRPAHCPQVTRVGERGRGRGAGAPGLPVRHLALPPLAPPESLHWLNRTSSATSLPSKRLRVPAPAPVVAGYQLADLGGAKGCVPYWAPEQGHLRERALAWESGDIISNH